MIALRGSLLCTAITLLSPSPGHAQSSDQAAPPMQNLRGAQGGDEELKAMEELLRAYSVSLGSFESSKLTDTPAAISYVTEDVWRAWGPRRMWDAMRFLPGLYVIPDFLPSITIRGFINRNVQREISLNIDGTNIASSMLAYLNINPSALARIEAMRGPGGTIYGSDAFAGTVGFDTWTSKDNRLDVQAGGGAYNYYDTAVRGHYNFTDKFSGTLILSAAGQRSVDVPYGYTDSFTGQHVGSSFAETYNTQNLILKANYEDNFSVGIYLTNVSTSGWPFLAGPGLASGLQVGQNYYSGLLTATGHQTLGAGLNLDESAFLMGGHMVTQSGLKTVVGAEGSQHGTNKTTDMMLGASVRLSQRVEVVPMEWNLAYQLRDVRESENTLIGAFGRSDGGPQVGPSSFNHGVILAGAGHLLDHTLNIDGGVRYDYFSLGKLSSVSGNAMLSYVPTEGTAIKAIYARGFRAPVSSEVYGIPPFFAPNQKLRPETMDNVELVFLTKHATWQGELTGFYGRTNNQINSVAVPFNPQGYAFQNQNRGALDGWGVEAAGDVSLQPVTMRAAVTYNYSRQRAEGGLPEQQILGFPAWMIDLGVSYEITAAELTLSAIARGMFGRGAGLGLPGYLASYFNGDLSATWRFGRLFKLPGGDWEAVAVLNNFTNSINALPTLQTYVWNHEAGIHGQGLVRWLW